MGIIDKTIGPIITPRITWVITIDIACLQMQHPNQVIKIKQTIQTTLRITTMGKIRSITGKTLKSNKHMVIKVVIIMMGVLKAQDNTLNTIKATFKMIITKIRIINSPTKISSMIGVNIEMKDGSNNMVRRMLMVDMLTMQEILEVKVAISSSFKIKSQIFPAKDPMAVTVATPPL